MCRTVKKKKCVQRQRNNTYQKQQGQRQTPKIIFQKIVHVVQLIEDKNIVYITIKILLLL